MNLSNVTVLIVEDGDEYLENLNRFVSGPTYIQAHNGAAALSILGTTALNLVYLDMRFDRIAHQDLLGDHAAATREQNGASTRGDAGSATLTLLRTKQHSGTGRSAPTRETRCGGSIPAGGHPRQQVGWLRRCQAWVSIRPGRSTRPSRPAGCPTSPC